MYSFFERIKISISRDNDLIKVSISLFLHLLAKFSLNNFSINLCSDCIFSSFGIKVLKFKSTHPISFIFSVLLFISELILFRTSFEFWFVFFYIKSCLFSFQIKFILLAMLVGEMINFRFRCNLSFENKPLFSQ